MSMSISRNAVSASEVNRLFIDRGGSAIPGLEQCDAAELKALKEGLGKFDEFAKEISKNPVLGNIAQSEAMKFLRDLAKTISSHATPDAAPETAQRVFTGMCGGGGGDGRVAPPPAPPPPAPPPVVAQPPATPPPPPAPPPPAQDAPPPVNTAPPSAGKPDPVTPPATPPQIPVGPLLALAAVGAALGAGAFNPLASNCCNGGAGAVPQGAGGARALGGSAGTGNAELDAMLAAGSAGGCFEDKVAMMMCQIIKKMQEDIEKRLEKLKAQAEAAEKGGGGKGGGKGGKGGGLLGSIAGIAGNMIAPGIGGAIGGMVGNAASGMIGGGGGGGAGGSKGQESRNIEFEMLKNEMQKLSQMQQAFSNVLNEMHNLAMSAIRQIGK